MPQAAQPSAASGRKPREMATKGCLETPFGTLPDESTEPFGIFPDLEDPGNELGL